MAAVTAMRWIRRCLTNVAALLVAPAQCHAGWEHTEVLTSFVVGVQ